MASRLQVSQPFLIRKRTVKRYSCIWAIEGWSAYLKQKERSPLEARLQTGQLSWKLELDCRADFDRKPPWALLRVVAELEGAPAAEVSAEGSCSLLTDPNGEAALSPLRLRLSNPGKSRTILMGVPEADVLATQKLPEIKVLIVLLITEYLSTTSLWELLTIEERALLPKEVFDFGTYDTAIVVDGHMIPVHRSVLAESSPSFELLLRVASWKRLELPDMDFQTAKELVKYAYLKREPNFQRIGPRTVPKLLKAAEKYGLEKLKMHVLAHIASNLDHVRAIDFLLHADKSDYSTLKTKVLLFIKNKKYLFTEAVFGRLKNRPDLMYEILDVICS